jgi:hypothetical protein
VLQIETFSDENFAQVSMIDAKRKEKSQSLSQAKT